MSSSGSETLKLVTKEKPSLVVLELLMPDLPGEDICRILKTDPNVKHIPIVVVTSKNDLQSKLGCLDLGVEEYLVKPLEPEELVARIVRFFKLMSEWKTKRSSGHIQRNRKHIRIRLRT